MRPGVLLLHLWCQPTLLVRRPRRRQGPFRISARLPRGFRIGRLRRHPLVLRRHGRCPWEVEKSDADTPAAEGTHFAVARTEDIVDDFGEAVLEFRVSSPNGGKLSFQFQIRNRAPVEDLVLKIDDREAIVFVDTTSDWQLEEFDIPAGEHVIRWVHRKNPGNLPEEELVMMESSLGISRIDDVRFHPY